MKSEKSILFDQGIVIRCCGLEWTVRQINVQQRNQEMVKPDGCYRLLTAKVPANSFVLCRARFSLCPRPRLAFTGWVIQTVNPYWKSDRFRLISLLCHHAPFEVCFSNYTPLMHAMHFYYSGLGQHRKRKLGNHSSQRSKNRNVAGTYPGIDCRIVMGVGTLYANTWFIVLIHPFLLTA